MLYHKSGQLVAADSRSYSFEFLISWFPVANPDLSSPIQPHPASRNNALRFLALRPSRSNPAASNGRQLQDNFFLGAKFPPLLPRPAHWHGCGRPEGHVHSGGIVLPIVLRTLLRSTSNPPSRFCNCKPSSPATLESPGKTSTCGASHWLLALPSGIDSSPERSRRRTQCPVRRGLHSWNSATRNRT